MLDFMDVHMHKDNISQNTNDFFLLPPFWPFFLFLYTACVQCKNVEMYTGPAELGQRGGCISNPKDIILIQIREGAESALLPIIFTSCYPNFSNLLPIPVCTYNLCICVKLMKFEYVPKKCMVF